MRKSCVFCGRSDRKISNEHAWPNWVRALFPPGRTTITSGLVEGTPRRWIAKDDMGVTVNAICKARNEGWLHKLENAVKPILSGPMQSGAAVTMSAPQQTSVATWAYKTAIVFEFAGHTPSAFYTPEERRALMQSGVAPGRNVFVNLAAYTGGVFCTAHHHMIGYDIEDHPTTSQITARCTTISIGKFAVQVMSIRLPDDVHQLQMPIRGERWDLRTVGIWPNPHATIDWPPAEILDDEGLVKFANRWNVGATVQGEQRGER